MVVGSRDGRLKVKARRRKGLNEEEEEEEVGREEAKKEKLGKEENEGFMVLGWLAAAASSPRRSCASLDAFHNQFWGCRSCEAPSPQLRHPLVGRCVFRACGRSCVSVAPQLRHRPLLACVLPVQGRCSCEPCLLQLRALLAAAATAAHLKWVSPFFYI